MTPDGARSPNVLVVDDDRHMRDLLWTHLSNAGYRVALAEDAVVARGLLRGPAPDLLIIAVQMPYLNGLDFVSALLADSTTHRVPVVFVSSKEGFASTAQVLGAGFLLRPFLKEELLDAVSRTLAGKQGANAASSAAPHNETLGAPVKAHRAKAKQGDAK